MKALLLAAALFAPPGKLLVEAPPYGSAIVEPGGKITRLGGWYDTAWSPDGTRVAGTDGRHIGVIGEWTLRRKQSTEPSWSSDGTLLAYSRAGTIRVVKADGSGDHAVGRGEHAAWRPGTHDLALVDRHGVIRMPGKWRSRPGNRVRHRGLLWSPQGGRLAAISGSYVRMLGPRGAITRRIPAGPRGHFQFGTYLGSDLVLVRHRFRDGATFVTRGNETLIADRGSVTDITPSPDGKRLLLGRRSRNQWQLWPPADPIRGVTRGVNPNATGRWAFPITRGWR